MPLFSGGTFSKIGGVKAAGASRDAANPAADARKLRRVLKDTYASIL
jgi:hypothetical protein